MPVHARVATDPIHPVLVEFPIVLYAATLAALVGHAIGGDVSWYRAALYTSGASIAMSVVAVVPTVVDLIAVSETPRLRVLGQRHALCNIASLVAFSAAFATIYSNYARIHELGDTAPLVLAIVGLAAAIAGAWLGWTMLALVGAPAPSHELVRRLPMPRR